VSGLLPGMPGEIANQYDPFTSLVSPDRLSFKKTVPGESFHAFK